jgi:hypothetical protein
MTKNKKNPNAKKKIKKIKHEHVTHIHKKPLKHQKEEI